MTVELLATCERCGKAVKFSTLNNAGHMTVSGIRFLEFDRDGTDVDDCFEDGREGAYVLCDDCFEELFRWMWPDRCCSELGGAE